MAQLIRGGWPYRHFPNAPFQLNRWSPQSKGLVAWWPTLGSAGGNVLRDFGGYGNDGVFPGGGADPSWVIDAEHGAVLDYDGNNDYVSCGVAGISGATGTISLWIKPHFAWNTGTDFRVLNLLDPGVQRIVDLYYDSVIDKWSIYNRAAANQVWSSQQTFSAGTWIHLTAAWDNAAFLKIWVNGTDEQTQADTWVAQTPDLIYIGAFLDLSLSFDGLIGDVRAANRVLSGAEVYQLYANPWELYRPKIRRLIVRSPAVVPPAVIMNQIQFANLGADLFNGALIQ